MEFFKKRSTAWIILSIVIVCSFFIGQAKRPADKIQILPSGVYVQDNADILSDSTEEYMTRLNNGLVSRLGAEIHVVTVNTTGGQDIFDTAIDVGVKTNLSSNSCVFLIAADDTDAVIVQGEGLIHAFPDDELSAILQENFTVQDFDDRTLDAPAKETFTDLIEMYEYSYGVSIAGTNQIEKTVSTGGNDMDAYMMAVIFFILLILVLVLIVSRPRRRRTFIAPIYRTGRTVVPPPRTGPYYNPGRNMGGNRNTTGFGGNSRTGGFGSSSRGGSFDSPSSRSTFGGSSRSGGFGSSSRGGSFSSSSRSSSSFGSSSSRSSFGGSSRSGGFGSSSRGGSFGGGSRSGGSRGGGFRGK